MTLTIVASRTAAIVAEIDRTAGFVLGCEQTPAGYQPHQVFRRWHVRDADGARTIVGDEVSIRVRSDGGATYPVSVVMEAVNSVGLLLDTGNVDLILQENPAPARWTVGKSGDAITATRGATVLHANESTGNDATGTGAAGAPYKTLARLMDANKASDQVWLLPAGQTFAFDNGAAVGGQLNVDLRAVTNWEVTRYGSGAAPTLHMALSTGGEQAGNPARLAFAWCNAGDFRQVGVRVTGIRTANSATWFGPSMGGTAWMLSATDRADHVTLFDTEADGMGLTIQPYRVTGLYIDNAYWRNADLNHCWNYNNAYGDGVPTLRWLGITDSDVQVSGSHLMRLYGCDHWVIADNRLGDASLSPQDGRGLLRLIAGLSPDEGGIRTSRFLSVYGNTLIGRFSTFRPVGIQLQGFTDVGAVEARWRNVTIERNTFTGGFAHTWWGVMDTGSHACPDITVRCNKLIWDTPINTGPELPNNNLLFAPSDASWTPSNLTRCMVLANTIVYATGSTGFGFERAVLGLPSGPTYVDCWIAGNVLVTNGARGSWTTQAATWAAISGVTLLGNHFRLLERHGSTYDTTRQIFGRSNYNGAFIDHPTYVADAGDTGAAIAHWGASWAAQMDVDWNTMPTSDLRGALAAPLAGVRYDHAGRIRPPAQTPGAVDPGATEFEEPPGGGGGGSTMLGTITITNEAPHARDGVAELGVPVPPGVLTSTATELKATGTGYLGEALEERVEWHPSDAEFAPLHPDGSYRYIRAYVPVSLDASTGAVGQHASRDVTLSVGAGTTRPFAIHPATLAGIQGTSGEFFVSVEGQSRSFPINLVDVLNKGEVLEGGGGSDHHVVYRLRQRLNPYDSSGNDLFHPLWIEITLDIHRGLDFAYLTFRFGNYVIQKQGGTANGAPLGTAEGPYPRRNLTLTGPIFLRLKTPNGNATTPHFELRDWGRQCVSRQTQGDGTAYFLLQPRGFPIQDKWPLGGGMDYEGVIFFGDPAAPSSSELAERWAPATDPDCGGSRLCAGSHDWPGRFGPFGHVPEYPPYINGRTDGVQRVNNMAAASRSFGLTRDPFQKGQFSANPNSRDTGNQSSFTVLGGWETLRTGHPVMVPHYLRSLRCNALRPSTWFEHDMRPFRAGEYPGIHVWDNVLFFSGAEFFGVPCSEQHRGQVEGDEIWHDSQTSSVWSGYDRQHWALGFDLFIALFTGNYLAREHMRVQCELWQQAFRVDSGNRTIDGPDAPRASGRGLQVAAGVHQVRPDPRLRAVMAARVRMLDSQFWAGANGQFLGLIQLWSSLDGPHPNLLPDKPGGVVWQEAMYATGMWAAYHVLREDPQYAAEADLARKRALEVSATITLYGFLDARTDHQVFDITNMVGDWNDRAALNGKTVLGNGGAATGIIYACTGVDFGGGAFRRVYLRQCSGTFLTGMAITVTGASQTGTVGIQRQGFHACVAMYANSLPEDAWRFGRPLDDEQLHETTQHALKGWFPTNALWYAGYTTWQTPAVCIALQGCREGYYANSGFQAAIQERAEAILGSLRVTQSAGWDDWTPWTAVIANPFGSSGGKVPAPPTNVQVTPASAAELAVTFDHDGQNVDGFILEHRPDGSGVWTALPPLVATERGAFIGGLAASSKHWVRVRAFNASGESANSPEASGTTLGAAKPNAPTGTTAAGVAGDAIRVDWGDTNAAPNNETHTTIEESLDGLTGWTEVGRVPADRTSFVRTGLPTSSTRFYRPRAWNGAVSSDPGPVAAGTTTAGTGGGAPPDAPTSFALTTLGSADLLGSCVAPAGGTAPQGYEWHLDAGAGFFVAATTGPGETSAQLSGLQDGTTYTGKVRAFNGGGPGPFSNTAMATTLTIAPIPPPVAPEDVVAVPVAWDKGRVAWTPISPAETEQQLQRRNVTSGGDWFPRAVLAPGLTFFDDSGLSAETTYEYRLRSVDATRALASDWSETASMTTPVKPLPDDEEPLKITGLAAGSIMADRLTASWTDTNSSPNEDGIHLELQPVAAEGDVTDPVLWQRVADLPADTVSHVVMGLTAERWYALRVRAHRAGLVGPWSDVLYVQTTAGAPGTGPAAPSNLQVTPGDTEAAATWDDNALDETAFHAELALGQGPFAQWGTDLPANTESLTVTGLQPRTTYRLRVRCSKDGVPSAYSNVVTFTTTAGAAIPVVPAAPGVLIARAVRAKVEVRLTWQDRSPNELGFEVYRKDARTGKFELRATLGPNVESWTDKDVERGSVYVYFVRAFNAAGASDSNTSIVATSFPEVAGWVKLNVRATLVARSR